MADRTDIPQLIDEIYDAALAPERWSQVLERIGDIFGGAACNLGIHNLPDRTGFMAVARLDPTYHSRFEWLYADPRRNPFLKAILGRPLGVPVLGDDFHDRREFFRTELYNEFLRPQGVQDGAAALLLRGPDHAAIWSLMQPDGAEPLGREDGRVLRFLMPHLQRSVQIFLRLGVLDARARATAEVLDHLPLGVALLGPKGQVLQLNRAAEALVARADGLRIESDGLHAARPAETRTLQRLVADAATTGVGHGTGAGGAMALSRPSGAMPLSVLVAPFAREHLACGNERPVAIVFVGDPEQEVATPLDLLRRLYGLTRAEAALAASLLHGKELAEVAEEAGVSLSTVRTQLKSVFAKTGARRQAELVRLLLRGPAGLLPA